MTPDEKASLIADFRAESGFSAFCEACLKIRAKDDSLVPFVLNEAQRAVHEKLEQQRAQRTWIRALILKGRQQGISTYIAARYYRRSTLWRGVNTYILSHEQASADGLFDMVERYQRNNPLAPHVGVCNAKELVFDKRESAYQVATAGQKAGGRGRSVTLFHGSEVAFWPNAPEHFAASVQAVPLLPGTEIILESTSAGSSGEFYNRWCDAEAGRGDYIPIFIPWWLSKEYSRAPDAGFSLSQEPPEPDTMSEQEYADTFLLSLPQMAWRRSKIAELRSDEAFRREYPATPSEAWTAPQGMEPFIKAIKVMRARKRQVDAAGPLVLGVDPASMGGDRFSVAARRGNRCLWVQHRGRINHMEATEWLRSLIDELKPARVSIDQGNIGIAIITNLKSINDHYVELVRGVNFGGTSQHKLAKPKVAGPFNRRAEMWARVRDWLDGDDVQIPDDDALQSDLTAPRLKPRMNHDFLLESKEQMRSRGVRSPDLADALALTFAFREFFKDYHEPVTVSSFGEVDSRPAVPVSSHVDTAYMETPQGWMM